MKIILLKRKYSCELPSCGRPQDCKIVPAQNMWISSYGLRRYTRISKKREKAVTTLVKKYDIFSRVLISPIKF